MSQRILYYAWVTVCDINNKFSMLYNNDISFKAENDGFVISVENWERIE